MAVIITYDGMPQKLKMDKLVISNNCSIMI